MHPLQKKLDSFPTALSSPKSKSFEMPDLKLVEVMSWNIQEGSSTSEQLCLQARGEMY